MVMSIEGGRAEPVFTITEDQLRENGGFYHRSHQPARPVYGVESSRGRIAGLARPVYVVPVEQLVSSGGSWPVYGGSATPMFLSGEGEPRSHLSEAIPVYVVGSDVEGWGSNGVSDVTLRLSWTDNADNETGFRIERSTNGVDFSEIATVDADTESYDDVVTPSATYTYRVRAYNDDGNSAYSNTDSESV